MRMVTGRKAEAATVPQNDVSSNRPRPALRVLLTLLVALQLIQVIGLGAFAFVAIREYRAARASLAQMVFGGLRDSPTAAARDLSSELLRRQNALATRLTRDASSDERKIAELQGRLNALYAEKGAKGGPINKLDQAIQLTLLMNDQMILTNHVLAQLQATLAQAVHPLARERDVPGVGGSGSGEAPVEKRSPRP